MELKKVAHFRRESFWKYCSIITTERCGMDFRYYRLRGKLHRGGGLPAWRGQGTLQWYSHGTTVRCDDLPTRASSKGDYFAWHDIFDRPHREPPKPAVIIHGYGNRYFLNGVEFILTSSLAQNSR